MLTGFPAPGHPDDVGWMCQNSPVLPRLPGPAGTCFCPPGALGGQSIAPHLTLGPVILPREQGLAPTVFLKALPIQLYHTCLPEGSAACSARDRQPGGQPAFVLSPLLQPEGPGPTRAGNPLAPGLTVNIVGALPICHRAQGPSGQPRQGAQRWQVPVPTLRPGLPEAQRSGSAFGPTPGGSGPSPAPPVALPLRPRATYTSTDGPRHTSTTPDSPRSPTVGGAAS